MYPSDNTVEAVIVILGTDAWSHNVQLVRQ